MKKAFLVACVLIMILSVISLGNTKLVWAVHWSDFQVDGIYDEDENLTVKGVQQYVDQYMKENPTVEIEIQPVPFDDYLKRILIGHTAGQYSDIYNLYSLWAVQLVDSYILDAPSPALIETVRKNFIPVSVQGSTIEGKIWGVPMEISNYTLIYNKKLFAEAGYQHPPKTWDELIDMAVNLTKRNEDGTIHQYGFAFLSGWDSAVVHPYLSMLYSLEGRLFTDDFSRSLLDSPEALLALEKQIELFKRGGTDTAGSVWAFPTGRVAMMIMASWYESSLKLGFGDEYEETVGVAPFPYLKTPANCGYTWFIGVDRNSRHKEEAWKFIQWMTTEMTEAGTTRMGELMARNIGSIPTHLADLDGFPDELNDLYTSVFVQELENTISEPNVAQGQEIKVVLMREIIEAWHGRKTPQQALSAAKREIDQILREFY